MLHILVTLPVEDRHRALIEASMPDGHFTYIYRDYLTPADVEAADLILGNVPPKMLAGVTKLKWLQLNSAGPDAYLNCMPEGVILTNSTGAYGLAISEHMLAMLLMLQKKLHLYYLDQKNHDWTDEGTVTSIEGSNVLVVGLGNIGGDFGRKLHALGATVYGITRSGERPAGSEDWLEEIYTLDALDTLLPKCEI
ncbi:MAG: D-2-hydroxyacid dehydrogenase, partial [Ruminococcaceae bacterium]|nr:D-2-hydroxyacid dehydrogenase [Oscillospiraceae bacterium]